jgi:enoyl-CoA hydratase
MIDVAEAFRLGLVNRVVSSTENVVDAARATMRSILANGPAAIAACIDVVNRGLDVALDEALALEASAFGRLAGTADMREGTSAFLEKRPPNFHGS